MNKRLAANLVAAAQAGEPKPAHAVRLPNWLPALALLLVLLGIVDATYLTIAHYTTPHVLACPDTGVINCAKVTTSSYSRILGVPVALLGLLFFVGNLPLHLPAAWRSASPWLRRLRLAAATTGILMVFWLIYVELFRLNAICLFCTAAHILTVLLFITTVLGTALTAEV